jgi:hypothetical protein
MTIGSCAHLAHLVHDDTEAEVNMPNNGGIYGILLANSESNCINEG